MVEARRKKITGASEEEKRRILESCHSGVAGMRSCQMYIHCSYIMIVHIMQGSPSEFHLY